MSVFSPDLGDVGSFYTYANDTTPGLTLAEAADVRNGPYDFGSANQAGIMFQRDAVEQQRMGQGYPANGQSWDFNAATLGVSRLIDSSARAFATASGTMPSSYAGQNGLTYVNGRNGGGLYASGNLLPLLLIGGALFLLMK